MNEPIHDRGYQLLFSNPVIFKQLLESFVNEPWVAELDFNRCEKLNKSFVSKDYEKRESDLIYQVPWQNQTAYVVILIEFQSTVQRFMAVRIWRYLAEFYTDWIETHQPKCHEKLPTVFPILLYNGEDRWTAPDNLADLVENNEKLGEFALHFKYLKIIENEFTVEQLLKIGNIVSTLFLAETHYDFEKLLEELSRLFPREDKSAISLFINWFKQLALRGRIDSDDYKEYEQLYQDEQEVGMLINSLRRDRENLYLKGRMDGLTEGEQKGRQEGRVEGWQEGRQEGRVEGWQEGRLEGRQEGKQEGRLEEKAEIVRTMLTEGFEPCLIAKLTQLSLEEIEQLRAIQ